MINSSILNASSFTYSPVRRDSYFESILRACVIVYQSIISTTKVQNNENEIRDEFIKYLQDINFKKQHELKNLKFDPETRENSGRADIRVLPTKDEYIDDDEYYLIECKRLDNKRLKGKSGLNAEYVKNGICRFVNNNYYSSFFGCNAMFGFLIAPVNIPSDIIGNINTLMSSSFLNDKKQVVNANATRKLTYENFANTYPYSYISQHKYSASGNSINLYHLIFDFSNHLI